MRIWEWIGKYRGKRIFREILLTCFGLASICIAAACMGGFFWFRATQMEKERQTAENIVGISALMIENEMSAVEDAMAVLRSDSYLKQVLERSDADWDEKMNVASKSVLNILSVNPLFQSIYVFKDNNFIIKTSNPSYPMNSQADEMMTGFFYGSQFGEWTAHHYRDVYGDERSVVSLSDGETRSGELLAKKGILISLDIGKLVEQVLPALREGEQYVFTDAKGRVLSGQGGLLAEEKTSISMGEDANGSVREVDGVDYQITRAEVKQGFYLIQLLPVHYVQEPILHMRNTFVWISVLLVVLVLLLAFTVSAWVYSPIAAVVNTTNNDAAPSKEMQGRLERTELSSIVQTYHSMVDNLKHMNMKKEQEELAAYLNDKKGQMQQPEWVAETYGKEGISCQAMCLRITEQQEQSELSTAESSAFERQTIANIAQQILSSLGSVLVNQVTEEYMAVLLFFEKPIEAEVLMEKMLEIHRLVRELVAIHLDTGVSSGSQEIADLASMYQMARAATAYRFLCGANSVIFEGEMVRRALHSEKWVDTEVVLRAVKEERKSDFTEEYDAVIRRLKDCSIQTAREVLLQMAAELKQYQASLNRQYTPISAADYEALNGELSKFEYIDDLRDYFLAAAEGIWLSLGQARQSGREDIVGKALAYLEEQYMDSNLSAQFLADQYHITPSYFSRLFNEQTGEAFPDYLAKIRLEHAKLLLVSRENRSIQEICKEVGYSNASYFTAIFKKNYGLTPGQYRKKYQESNKKE